MKQKYGFALFLMFLFCFGLRASAVKVTFEWDTPGAVELRLDSTNGPKVELGADQTTYIWESEGTYGYVYAFATDGYRLLGAETADGEKTFKPTGTPLRLSMSFYSSDDGQTVKITTAKLVRNDEFKVDVVNGLMNIVSAQFNSGYTLDLEKGEHTYKFNEEYDNPLTISLDAVAQAYSITLNGKEIEKNTWYPRYDNIEVKPGDLLKIQVFENDADEPEICDFKIEYSSGMDGCIETIRNNSSGTWYYPEDFASGNLTILENTELRVNFVKDDYIISKIYLNGDDITNELVTSSFDGYQSLTLTVTEKETVLKIEGTPKEYGTIDFIGYIINADGVDFSMSYGGKPFEIAAGEDVDKDIRLSATLTMPASETKKYVIPIDEKIGKFFFSPKEGYYISNVYTLTPYGTLEPHSGNSSMSATIDGTTFYMIVDKLPEAYHADLNIIGDQFNLRITTGGSSSQTWGNTGSRTYSSEPGEKEIEFIPGLGTPILFAFTCDENQTAAVYLDGAEIHGVDNDDSGAIEFSVTPYYPIENDNVPEGVQSEIIVYNSNNERPQMSGASLEFEDGTEGEFFYSPVLHKGNPGGQPVIAGTQFVVKPSSSDMGVEYHGEIYPLDENGEYVFNATGNARANVVKIVSAETLKNSAVYGISSEDSSSKGNIYSIDGRVVIKNAEKEDIDSLEKGIYIINGKKRIVK